MATTPEELPDTLYAIRVSMVNPGGGEPAAWFQTVEEGSSSISFHTDLGMFGVDRGWIELVATTLHTMYKQRGMDVHIQIVELKPSYLGLVVPTEDLSAFEDVKVVE